MNGNHFMIDPANGKLIIFNLSPEGLYYYKITEYPHYTFIETVSDNMEEFTMIQIKKALEARKVLEMVGCQSEQDFEKMLWGRLIQNCPVTTTDLRIAQQLFGPHIAFLKGKTMQITPPAVRMDCVEVPNEIYERNKLILFVMDIMSVNGL